MNLFSKPDEASPLRNQTLSPLFEATSLSQQVPPPRARCVESVLTEIYRQCHGLVVARAKRILNSEAAAQDIAQQVFIRLLEDLHAGVDIRNPRALCYQAATNLALNHLRDSRRRDELLAQQMWARVQDATAESQQVVRELLQSCDAEAAIVAAYHYLDGLDQSEIAELLGTSRRTVNRRLERFDAQARALLRAELSAEAAIA